MGLFSSLFIRGLKCSLGAPFPTLLWLKRLSERHSFQHGLAQMHACTDIYITMLVHKTHMKTHTHIHTPQLLYIFFLRAHNVLLAMPLLPKVQAPYSWYFGLRPDTHTHTLTHPQKTLPNVSLQWGTDCSHFSCKLALSLTSSSLLSLDSPSSASNK